MSFGRQRNMVRRASRPDESFHRNRRRKAVDRLAMLVGGRPHRPSLLSRLLKLIGIRGG